MGLFGAHAVVSGAVVQARGFAVEIKNNCNAIYEFGLFAAAVWAYPAPIGAKVVGTLVGAAVLNVVNVVRVVSLLALGAFARDWFDAAHLYAWASHLLRPRRRLLVRLGSPDWSADLSSGGEARSCASPSGWSARRWRGS